MTHSINIPLSPQELEALRNFSESQLRHPRDQARLILRAALLGESPSNATNSKPANQAFQGATVNGFGMVNP